MTSYQQYVKLYHFAYIVTVDVKHLAFRHFTLSFGIGFVIGFGFWNLQQFFKSNTQKKIETVIFLL